jgi:hypothetical protein
MTNILDTVTPSAWQLLNPCPGNDWKGMKANAPEHDTRLQELGWEPLYSRETLEPAIERLLAEHRKQVLLEAAEMYGKGRLDQPQYSNGYGDAYIVGWINGTAVYRDELRRMAEGEK